MMVGRPTRREFIQTAGLVAAGVAALGTAGCLPNTGSPASSSRPSGSTKTRSFRSRPDLKVPILTVSYPSPQPSPRGRGEGEAGLFFVAPGGPMIADANGEPIWFHPVSKNVANFRAQMLGSEPVLTWWEGTVGKGYGLSGQLVIADTTYKELHRVSAGNGFQADLHEFVVTAKETALLTAYHEVPGDLSAFGGPAQGTILDSIVQEVDIASSRVLFEWHSLGHIALNETHATYTKGQPFDYFHINSIEEDSDGNLLISARNTWAIYKIDRGSGAVMWRLGGRQSSFAMGSGTIFAWQHDARRQSDGTITLFDDGAAPKVESQSRGMVLTLDEALMKASLSRQYTHGGNGISASSQGNLQVLSNGDVLVGWGSEPYFTEFDAQGHIVADGKFAGTFQSYRAFRLPWSAQPSDPPAIAAEKAGSGAIVYASWNGATDVDRWEAMGGSSADSLQRIGAAKRSGFETAIKISSQPAFVAARALDASGTVLGTSPAITL